MRVSILHPLMLATYVKVFAICALVMAALLSFLAVLSGSPQTIPGMLELVAVVCGGLTVITVPVAALVYRRGLLMVMRVDENGADTAVADHRARAMNTIAVVSGALAGKPQVAASGLLAAATSRQHASWQSVARAKYYPRWHVIALANAWRTIVVLYCRPENYERVAALIARSLAARTLTARKSPLPALLLHTALVVAASLPLFVLPFPVAIDLLPPLFVLCFALAAVWFVPLLVYAMFGALIWVAAAAALAGMQPYRSILDGHAGLHYELMGTDDWVLVAIAALGAAYLIWLGVALLRGRVKSALAGDLEETER